MCLVACKQNEVKLHQDVGTVYGTAHGEMGGDGIVFYVDEGAGYALVCSMNDLRRDRLPDASRAAWEKDFTWSVFGSDTVMERDTVWCEITRTFKCFVGKTIEPSVPASSIVDETEPFAKYNYEEKDSIVTIYPILRYKATKENGDPVLAGYTRDSVPVKNFGFIGEFIPADTILTSVKVEIFSDTTWKEDNDTVTISGQKYIIAVGGKFDRDKNVTLYRPYVDTVERRTRTFSYIEAGYSDTNVNGIRKGDRKYPNSNNWEYELDTNWSYSRIGIGEDDPDGMVNTNKILTADVPCRQLATPDSSSAARVCHMYYTNNYSEIRNEYAGDTAYKSGQGQWYLPSRAELRHLFDAKNKINDAHVNTKGFEPLQNCYWSSNERDAKNAWYKCFSDNGVESYIPKANNNYRVNIRAVRKVKWPLK
ncbi:MAG: DUF1566 domain-containing protein [Bacteroidales bacterium]|nr:DUF1566 domain-containing protein [Bacteroidales bacterium]